MQTLESCSMCGSTDKVVPKAGSGVESHTICLKCVDSRGIEILPEYRDNIKNFGHWWSGDMKERIELLEKRIDFLLAERKNIMAHYTPEKLNKLDEINHELPYRRTELENLKEKDV